MKKWIAAAVSAVLVAAIAVSVAACSSSVRVKLVNVMLTGEEYGYCVDKDNTELMTAANDLIKKLCGDEPYNPEAPVTDVEGVQYDLDGDGTAEKVTFDSLYKAATGDTVIPVKDTYTEVPSGKTREECLVVATNAEFEPFEFMDGEKFAGIDMHIAKMLAESLNKTLVIKHMNFEVVINDVENGASDIGMAGLTINRGREQVVSFTNGYYTTSQYIAVAESDTTFDSCKTEAEVVAAINGLIAKENVISTFGTIATCLALTLPTGEFAEGVPEAIAMANATGITVPAMISFIAFNMLTIPCFAACATAKAELPKGKFKWTLLFWLATSYTVSMMIYLIGSWWWTCFIFAALIAAAIAGIVIWNKKHPAKQENVAETVNEALAEAAATEERK